MTRNSFTSYIRPILLIFKPCETPGGTPGGSKIAKKDVTCARSYNYAADR